MWIRKSDSNIGSEIKHKTLRRRFNPRLPAIIAVVSGILIGLRSMFGAWPGFYRTGLRVPATGYEAVLCGIRCALIGFVILYVTQIILGVAFSDKGPFYICPCCKKLAGRFRECKCDVKLEPIEYWEWVEDSDRT
jgi:hypothetical protein